MNKQYCLFLFTLVISIGCASNSPRARDEISSSCQEGAVRQGYISPNTLGDLSCSTGTQVCSSGHWQGPQIFDTCENLLKSCNGSLHGSLVSGYLSPTGPNGIPCSPATKTCINGNWAGPEVYTSCTQLP